jgi:hypothetical protein
MARRKTEVNATSKTYPPSLLREGGSECHIENISAFTQERPGLMRLRDALVGETDIGPASEAVFQIPRALSVTK